MKNGRGLDVVKDCYAEVISFDCALNDASKIRA